MSDTLLEVKAGPQLSSGIFPGLPGEAPLLWADGENILFESGQVQKNQGYSRLAPATTFAATPSGIITALAGTERRAFLGAGAKVYAYRTLDDLTEIGSGFAAGSRWQFLNWGNWLIGNNQVVKPQIWKHTSTTLDTTPADLTSVFTRANGIAKFGQYLLAFGTSNDNNQIEWSTFGDPEDFTVTLTGSAGNTLVRESNGSLIAAVRLGEAMAFYTESQMLWFRFVGGTSRFGYKMALESIGAITPHSVVSTGMLNYGLTPDFAFVTDGSSFQHIHEPAMKKWLEANVDWTRQSEVSGVHDKLNSRIIWFVPVTGGGVRAIAFRTSERTWTRLNAGMVCAAEQGVWPTDLWCDSTRLFEREKDDYNIAGGAVAAYIQSKPLDLGYRRRYKRIDKLVFDGEITGNVEVSFAFMDNPMQTPSFETPVTLEYETWVHRESPFVAFKILAEDAGSFFKMNGFSFHGAYTGYVN